jgi:hypothetical protein
MNKKIPLVFLVSGILMAASLSTFNISQIASVAGSGGGSGFGCQPEFDLPGCGGGTGGGGGLSPDGQHGGVGGGSGNGGTGNVPGEGTGCGAGGGGVDAERSGNGGSCED